MATELEASPEAISSIEIASFSSRMLAALLDYIISVAVFVLLNRLNPNPDLSFLSTLLSGALYFGVVHSSLTQGQSLGKKAFGLRVLHITEGRYLTPLESVRRYFCYLGLVILLVELPANIYRQTGFTGTPYLLELNMLCAMAYFLTDVSLCLLSADHRSLHDILCSSIVVRGEGTSASSDIERARATERRKPYPFPLLRRPYIPGAASIIFALFLWSLGFSSSTELQTVGASRYVLEHRYPIRILSLAKGLETLKFEALLIDAETDSKRIAARIAEDIRALLPAGHLIQTLEFTFYKDPSLATSENAPTDLSLRVHLETLSVEEFSPEKRLSAPSSDAR